MQTFYTQFAYKIEIFDPLDRPIKYEANEYDEDPENQAISSADLKKRLLDTEKIFSDELLL